ncbi:hypothetical protein [Acetobacterium woodii]|uniref:hypothetical protein n=1 Tax=Acetobacterium woodii TaxID=33952 RepID=UPI0003105E8A|nr:hypothetical protein [Acetobacterium woodii]
MVAKESKRLKKDLSETKKQVTQLNRELKRKEATLAETATLLGLKKGTSDLARGRMIPVRRSQNSGKTN